MDFCEYYIYNEFEFNDYIKSITLIDLIKFFIFVKFCYHIINIRNIIFTCLFIGIRILEEKVVNYDILFFLFCIKILFGYLIYLNIKNKILLKLENFIQIILNKDYDKVYDSDYSDE